MNKTLVCPVAFNEHVKLKNVIKRFIDSPVYGKADYLIVDDASDDGTSDLIRGFSHCGIKTIRHECRQGVGAAIRSAIVYARKQKYLVLVIMAGNDKDDPKEIPRLVDPIMRENYDFVQGSRYLTAGGIGGDMPAYRKMATKIHPWLMSMVTRQRITDSTNGFRALRLRIFDNPAIDIHQSWLSHYEMEPYLLFKVLKLGLKWTERPVTKIYPKRQLGYTKMRPIIGWWSILRPVIYLGLGIKK